MSNQKHVEMSPILQTMYEYIENHLYDELMDEVEAAVKHNLFEGLKLQASENEITLDRENSKLSKTDLWMVNRTTLITDISAYLKVGIQRDAQVPKYRVHRVNFAAFFTLDNGIQYIPGIFNLATHYLPERQLPRLSKYLVPILSYEDMENMVLDMLRKYLGEQAINSFQPDGARNLAAAMGLTIMSVSLYKDHHTAAVLFLKESTVRAYAQKADDAQNDELECQEIRIPARTIVLNCNRSDQGAFEWVVYHECCHYEWHSMFYEPQELHAADLRLLKYDEVEKASTPAEKDIRWIERQAAFVGIAAMLPKPVFLPMVRKCWKSVASSQENIGEKYAHIIYSISSEKRLSKGSIKSRLVSLGASEAKGAFNYVDRKYIHHFAYNTSETESTDTFVINRSDFTTMYEQDEKFRDLISTHQFIYVDGHVCCNQPEYVRQYGKELSLTSWALAHVDQCCLKFAREYHYDHSAGYQVGELKSDDEYNESYLTIHSLDISNLSKQEIESKNAKYLASLPTTPAAFLTKLVKDRLKTEIALAATSGLSKSTINRMCNDEDFVYTIQEVTRLVIGLQLPPPLSSMLLELARFPRTAMVRYYQYQCIIDCLFMDDIETVVKAHPKLSL